MTITLLDVPIDLLFNEIFPKLLESEQWALFISCKTMYFNIRKKIIYEVTLNLEDQRKSTYMKLSYMYDMRRLFLHKLCLSRLTYRNVPMDKCIINLCEQNAEDLISAMCRRNEYCYDKITWAKGLLILIKNRRCDFVKKMLLQYEDLFFVSATANVYTEDNHSYFTWEQIRELASFPSSSNLIEDIVCESFKTNNIEMIKLIINYYDRWGYYFVISGLYKPIDPNVDGDMFSAGISFRNISIDDTRLYYIILNVADNPELLDFIKTDKLAYPQIYYFMLQYRGQRMLEFFKKIGDVPKSSIDNHLQNVDADSNLDVIKYMISKRQTSDPVCIVSSSFMSEFQCVCRTTYIPIAVQEKERFCYQNVDRCCNNSKIVQNVANILRLLNVAQRNVYKMSFCDKLKKELEKPIDSAIL